MNRFPRLDQSVTPVESASKTTVTVEFDLVEPLLPFWQLVNESRIHGLDELQLSESKGAEAFWFHGSDIRAVLS